MTLELESEMDPSHERILSNRGSDHGPGTGGCNSQVKRATTEGGSAKKKRLQQIHALHEPQSHRVGHGLSRLVQV